MISLTRLNGSVFAVNPDLIERVSSNPDTTVHLVDGSTYIVTQTVEEIIAEIREFRAGVLSDAFARLRGDLAGQGIGGGG